MSDPTIDALEDNVQTCSPSKRAWFLPVLRALDELGGEAPPREVRRRIREMHPGQLTEKQWAWLERIQRIGWARNEMRRIGLIGGEHGVWALADLGRAYLDAHRDDEVSLPADIQEDGGLPAEDEDIETVPVTDFRGYDIPLLRIFASGLRKKREVFEQLEATIGEQLLAGDRRVMRNGRVVWSYRASWSLSDMKSAGALRNPARGIWEITDAGRERLDQEAESWDITRHQDSKAQVLRDEPGKPKPVDEDESERAWEEGRWAGLKPQLDDALFDALAARLRPDLGPTPSIPIARNVVLFGPPGTGKTFIAKKAASALTGESEASSDGRYRIVQFHPSYAYEDFVQGLRPDVERPDRRYEIKDGPFLTLCGAAEKEPEQFFVLIIDEVNRGDPARIFGELLYGLEYRGESIALPLGGQLRVPPNLVVLGTMNSVDRSVALVDYALRRRFGFVRLEPDPSLIGSLRTDAAAPIAARLLAGFNDWLVGKLDADHALGHSLFLNGAISLATEDGIERVWQLDVEPLLEEYFFGEPDRKKLGARPVEEVPSRGSKRRRGRDRGHDGRTAGSILVMRRTVWENVPFSIEAEHVPALDERLGGRLQRCRDGWVIRQVVGHVVLPSRHVIEIRSPKAPAASMLAWMAYADPTLAALVHSPVPATIGQGDLSGLTAFLFVAETLRVLRRNGVQRNYHRRRLDSTAVRGRIDFPRLARRGGNLSRLPCVGWERVPETPLNRFLAAALHRVEHDQVLRAAAGEMLPPLRAHLDAIRPAVDSSLLAGKSPLPRTERAFDAPCALARLILTRSSVGERGDRCGPAFLIDIAQLFEKAVAKAFRESRVLAQPKAPVRYARSPSAAAGHRTAGQPMEIDVLLTSPSVGPVVVDAKYKTEVAAANLHQMVSYCFLTGARRAVLVFPEGHPEDPRSYLFRGGRHADAGEIRVDIVTLETGATTVAGWRRAAEKLVQSVLGAGDGRVEHAGGAEVSGATRGGSAARSE